jgi:hypothetical protein
LPFVAVTFARRSALAAASPFAVSAPLTYLFSFCGNVPGSECGVNKTAAPALRRQPGSAQCDTAFGQLASVKLSTLANPDDGFYLEYNNGPPCPGVADPGPTFSQFTVQCAPGQPGRVLGIPTINQCSVQFVLESQAGCPVHITNILRTLGVGWIVFLAALVCAVLYLAVGILYKRRKYGASGIEAVPNIDLWRSVGNRVAAVATCGRKRVGADGDVYVQAADGEYAYSDKI